MKCEYCAGNLSIEEPRCPHCDAENPYYKAHRADMAAYAKRYKATEEKVVENSRRFNARAVNIAIIAVLVALIAIAIGVLVNADDIAYDMMVRKDTRNANAIAAYIGELEEAKDYSGMASYQQMHYVYGSYKTDLNQYNMVISTANSYASILNSITRLVYAKTIYDKPSSMASSISRNISSMYLDTYGDRYLNHKDADYYAPKHYAAMEDMINKTHLLFKTYLGFTQEEIDGFIDLTDAKRQVLLEEKIMEVMEREGEEE